VLLAAVALPAAPAEAAFPGTNGLIAFVRQADGSTAKEIHTLAPDGTLRNLSNPTNAPCVSVEVCRRDVSPAFSSDGKKIVFVSNRDGNDEIYVMNADGTAPTRVTTTTSVSESDPGFSPDSRQIVYAAGSDIWVMDAGGTNQRKLTSNGTTVTESGPVFSPDGTKIAYTSGVYDLFIMDADGSNPVNLFPDGEPGRGSPRDPAFSPDGKRLAFSYTNDRGTLGQLHDDIGTINLETKAVTRVTTHGASDRTPAFSPTGDKIAFASSGSYAARSATASADIYVLPSTGPDNNPPTITNRVLVGAAPSDDDTEPDWGVVSGSAPDSDGDGT
jgi:Tol biopolymer transport system component